MSNESLHKLEVSYNQAHDRLILILHTQNMNEYRFWLTRRAVPLLWQLLQQLIKSDKKKPVVQQVKEKEQWNEAIKKEQGQKHAVAEQLSTRISKRPMGDDPLLLAKMHGGIDENGVFKLRLEDVAGRWIEFTGQSTVLIAICQLIQETLQKTDWNLNLPPLE